MSAPVTFRRHPLEMIVSPRQHPRVTTLVRARLVGSAFGTRCDPLKMEESLASVLQADVAERWAQVADGSTPEDIARLGAANPAQAVLAYASLRLAARLAPGDHARQARDASERILDALKDGDALLEGGPYRSTGQPQLPAGANVTDGADR